MTLPPHLSPFTKEGDYEPERLIQLKELKGETSTGQNKEVEEEVEEEEEADNQFDVEKEIKKSIKKQK